MSYQINNFPTEEYHARIKGTRAEMAARGLDCIIISDPSNMAWISGYDGWSFYVHQAVLLGMEGDPVYWMPLARSAPCSWAMMTSSATPTIWCRTPKSTP